MDTRCVLKAPTDERVRVYRRSAWRDVSFAAIEQWDVFRFVDASREGVGATPYRALSQSRADGPGRLAIDAIASGHENDTEDP